MSAGDTQFICGHEGDLCACAESREECACRVLHAVGSTRGLCSDCCAIMREIDLDTGEDIE